MALLAGVSGGKKPPIDISYHIRFQAKGDLTKS